MGHEYCGIVEEVGSEVKTVKPGQFVTGSFAASDNSYPIANNCPAFCGMRLLYRKGLMWASMSILNLGWLLRASSEVPAYEANLRAAWKVMPVSTVTELTAVTSFAVNLGIALLLPPPRPAISKPRGSPAFSHPHEAYPQMHAVILQFVESRPHSGRNRCGRHVGTRGSPDREDSGSRGSTRSRGSRGLAQLVPAPTADRDFAARRGGGSQLIARRHAPYLVWKAERVDARQYL
jgi:alcohol dehydrogenase-like protein